MKLNKEIEQKNTIMKKKNVSQSELTASCRAQLTEMPVRNKIEVLSHISSITWS